MGGAIVDGKPSLFGVIDGRKKALLVKRTMHFLNLLQFFAILGAFEFRLQTLGAIFAR